MSRIKARLSGINVEVKERKDKVGATITIYIYRCEICGKLLFGLTENLILINAYNHIQVHASTHPEVLEKITLEYKTIEI
ncbi:MAG: hypothetical protein QXX12_04115 [Nanopusillaceae archaeon]